MRLRTEFSIAPIAHPIDIADEIFSLGSCFSERISERFFRVKFRGLSNPYGVLFNPASIAKAIERIADKRMVTERELHRGSEGWFHYDMHSSLSRSSIEQCVEAINAATLSANEALSRAKHLIITFGTAIVYERKEDLSVVANCHKQPQREFHSRVLSTDEIVAMWREIIRSRLHDKSIILTLSPVRHIADSAELNSLSKATLRCAIAKLCEEFDNICYFPSFEIMMDDLRDYRFYDEDLVHPSKLAVDYIWERFSAAALTPRTREILPEIEAVIAAAEHRPLHPESEAHSKFMAKYAAIAEQLQLREKLSFEREIAHFRRKALSK